MKATLFRRTVVICLLAVSSRLIATAQQAEIELPSPEELKQGPSIPPQILKASHPEYPITMRAAGLEARVLLEFIVDKEGQVRNPHVVRSNNPWFERPALDAILKWRFKPATVGGRLVNTRVQQEIQFNLYGGGQDLWRVSRMKNHDELPVELRWDVAPTPVHTNYPVYPLEALRAKKSGKVLLRYIVDPTGMVVEAAAIESSAPEFAGAALAAIDAWRFKPATRAGKPCFAVLQLTWEFDPGSHEHDTVPISDGARAVLRELRKKEPRIVGGDQLDGGIQPISRRPPIYPTSLRRSGEQGSADIEFFIDAAGDAQLPRVLAATKSEFGYAAVQAVASWRFHPPMRGSREVMSRAQIRVSFSLQNPPSE